MNEEGLKLWQVIKLCEEGAYIRGDIFRNEFGGMITFYGDYFNFTERAVLAGAEYQYYGNQFEVKK